MILITGGFGFLGTHLVETILHKEPKAKIVIVDNLSSSPVDPYEFIDSLGNPKNVTYHISNIRDFKFSAKFTEVYHLASYVGPAGVLPHSGYIAQSMINDSLYLAKRCAVSGARLLFVSTSEIYGGGTCKEGDNKLISADYSPRLEYAVGKLASEIALLNFTKKYTLNLVIVRPFNIAGPRQSENGGFVLPRFCRMALEGSDLTVFGDGQQMRSFTHVKDVAFGLHLAMKEGQTGEAYNIGAEENKTTIEELAQKVIDISGSKSKIAHINPKDIYGQTYEEAKDKISDSSKAREKLEWVPIYTIEYIIADTLKFIKGSGK